jgi:hypothetical protein
MNSLVKGCAYLLLTGFALGNILCASVVSGAALVISGTLGTLERCRRFKSRGWLNLADRANKDVLQEEPRCNYA